MALRITSSSLLNLNQCGNIFSRNSVTFQHKKAFENQRLFSFPDSCYFRGMKYVPTIGLEIHAELKTRTKMFCDSLNDPNESHPNINICPVCMGHPGTLPVPNKAAIEHVVRVGFALHSEIAENSKFDRKNYFYPDLPKGYQISQYDMPFCSGGYLDIETGGEGGGEFKRIEIERVHLEEDTARLIHSKDGKYSFVDFNRAGVPLMELVTKPVIHTAREARRFAEELQLILRYLGVSDADMDKGQMRVEVNISVAPEGSSSLGTKVELKNLNSLRVAEAGIVFETNRQSAVLNSGEAVVQETRGWDENKKETFSQRKKEDASEYRYFPEPDIPPLILKKEYGFDREALRASIPELPQQKRKRFIKEYTLTRQTADVFVHDRELSGYYEQVISELMAWEKEHATKQQDKKKLMKLATNYTIKNLRTLLQEHTTSIEQMRITAENFAEYIYLIHRGEISSTAAREVLLTMFETGGDPSNIIEEKGLKQVSGEDELASMIDEAIKKNPKAIEDYKKGKETALKFLVGAVMAASRGSANPQVVEGMLKKKLG